MERIDISVIILTYNTKLKKVIDTINSILMQEGLYYEIIISDDGSADNNFVYLKTYLEEKCKGRFQLLSHKENRGTVKNLLDGIEHAQGKYIKGLGAGDLFYENDTLKKWYLFMERNKARVSFCNAVYFSKDNEGKKRYLKIKDNPQRPQIYLTHNINYMKRYFLVYNDLILGAKFLVERVLFEEYLKRIESTVKLAEDNIFRIMLCDNIPFSYFNELGIYYEYGTGIWSSKNSKYFIRLQEDWKETNKIIERYCNNELQKYRLNLNVDSRIGKFNKIKRFISQIDIYLFRLIIKICPRYTDDCCK